LAQSIEQITPYRREKFLFAYVVDILQRAGLTNLRKTQVCHPDGHQSRQLHRDREASDAIVLRPPCPQLCLAFAWL